jgi:hypothetical protein
MNEANECAGIVVGVELSSDNSPRAARPLALS